MIAFDKIVDHINFDTISKITSLQELDDLLKAIRAEKGQLSIYEKKIERRGHDLTLG